MGVKPPSRSGTASAESTFRGNSIARSARRAAAPLSARMANGHPPIVLKQQQQQANSSEEGEPRPARKPLRKKHTKMRRKFEKNTQRNKKNRRGGHVICARGHCNRPSDGQRGIFFRTRLGAPLPAGVPPPPPPPPTSVCIPRPVYSIFPFSFSFFSSSSLLLDEREGDLSRNSYLH